MKYGGRGKPYQFVAGGYIVHNQKVLLIYHSELNRWLPPGGHIKQDKKGYFMETPEETVIREVREETGLDVEIIGRKVTVENSRIKALFLPESIHIHEIDEKHDHLAFDYFCRPISSKPKLKNSKEGKLRWFSVEELKNYPKNSDMSEEVRIRAIEAIEKLSGK
jgi:ADP-ribose pyrophosphatase YjhB (NUDIX family)